MNKGSYVFSQMVKALDEFVFLRIVKKYDGDKYVKHFSCWNQLLEDAIVTTVVRFGQVASGDVLAETESVELVLERSRCYDETSQ